jgi:hypothetical protein
MWFTLRRLIAPLVKLTLATLKLDDQSAYFLRLSRIRDWKVLPERVS